MRMAAFAATSSLLELFASPDSVARLNGIVHPVLIEQLSLRILDPVCCTVSSPRYPFAVVEVSARLVLRMHLAWLMKFWSSAPLCQFVASAYSTWHGAI